MTTTANLVAGRTPVSPTEKRAALAAMRSGYHLVCVDTETTGKHATDRIISIALIPWVSGKMTAAWSTLVNPRLARIGAGHIHGITAADLAGAPEFAVIADDIRSRLTPPRGKTTVLVGHNVAFDAARLTYEYLLLGQKLPDLLLLDTLTLAHACGVNPGSAKFSALLSKLDLRNPQEHQAASDAMYTGFAAIELMDRLAHYGQTSISELLGPSKPASGREAADAPVLDAEHQAAHDADISRPGKVRDDALAYCLSVNCPDLPDRLASLITGPTVARHLADWTMDKVATAAPTRIQFGLLMGCLGRAMKQAHLPTAEVVRRYNKLTPALNALGPCSPTTGMCDRCTEERTCRLVRIRHRFVNAYLYNEKGQVTLERAAMFLPVPKPVKKGPKPKTSTRGWFTTLMRAGDHHAAAYGAVLCANARHTPKDTSWALATMERAWKAGLRSPGVAYTYSALIERHAGRNAATELPRYYKVCADGVAVGPGPDRYYWNKLVARAGRLKKATDAASAAARPTGKVSARCHDNQPLGPRNTRTAPGSRFVRQKP